MKFTWQQIKHFRFALGQGLTTLETIAKVYGLSVQQVKGIVGDLTCTDLHNQAAHLALNRLLAHYEQLRPKGYTLTIHSDEEGWDVAIVGSSCEPLAAALRPTIDEAASAVLDKLMKDNHD